MRYEYIDPFVKTTVKVLDTIIQSDIAKGKLKLYRGDEVDYDVAIFIKLRGASEDGIVIVNMETETAMRLSNLMTGDAYVRLSALVLETVSELANMIVGNATSILNDMGSDFTVSPPLVVAKNYILRKVSEAEIFQVPLFTSCGLITVNASMRTN